MTIDPKAVDTRNVRKTLLRLMLIGAHRKGARRDECHAGSIIVSRGKAGVSGTSAKCTRSGCLLRDAGAKDSNRGAYRDQSSQHNVADHALLHRHHHLPSVGDRMTGLAVSNPLGPI